MPRTTLPRLCLMLLLAGSFAACAAHERDEPAEPVTGQRDISKVNGGIELRPGSEAGDVSTVNGGLRFGSNSRARKVDNVNGGIQFGDSVTVEEVTGVNGGISAGRDLRVEHGIDTVNGGVHLGSGAEIGGDLSTVNGGVTLERARINGRLQMSSGTIDTGSGSTIGGIVVSRPNGSSKNWGRKPRVVVGPDSVVGDIELERETELFVHRSARTGTVSGGSAVIYTGDVPG